MVEMSLLPIDILEPTKMEPSRTLSDCPGRRAAWISASDPPKSVLDQKFQHDPRRHTLVCGDNLDALKLLLPSLERKVRVIYIDPPYNTGNGLLYNDRFGSWGRDGDRHAAWLSMMAPRLLLAWRFLRDDGVFFASIDDRELPRLRLLCDEVFGEDNLVSTVIWRKKVVRGRGNRHILPQTEYILAYARNIDALPPFHENLTPGMKKEYAHHDSLGPYKKIPLAKSGTRQSPRPNLYYSLMAPDGSEIPCPTHQWRWSRETVERRKNEILMEKNRKGRWTVYTKQYLRSPEGEERKRTPESYYDRVTTSDGTAEMKELFGEVVLDFPKPSRLIRDLISWTTPRGSSDPVMDFFAGSGSTGQAVLELNAQDGGSRPFYLVQSDDPIVHPEFRSIYEICRGRVERVIKRLEKTGHSPLEVREYRVVGYPLKP